MMEKNSVEDGVAGHSCDWQHHHQADYDFCQSLCFCFWFVVVSQMNQ